MRATCPHPSHIIYFIILKLFAEDYSLWSSLFCNFLKSLGTSSHLAPSNSLNTLFCFGCDRLIVTFVQNKWQSHSFAYFSSILTFLYRGPEDRNLNWIVTKEFCIVPCSKMYLWRKCKSLNVCFRWTLITRRVRRRWWSESACAQRVHGSSQTK
jgi:hypothetical protein